MVSAHYWPDTDSTYNVRWLFRDSDADFKYLSFAGFSYIKLAKYIALVIFPMKWRVTTRYWRLVSTSQKLRVESSEIALVQNMLLNYTT